MSVFRWLFDKKGTDTTEADNRHADASDSASDAKRLVVQAERVIANGKLQQGIELLRKAEDMAPAGMCGIAVSQVLLLDTGFQLFYRHNWKDSICTTCGISEIELIGGITVGKIAVGDLLSPKPIESLADKDDLSIQPRTVESRHGVYGKRVFGYHPATETSFPDGANRAVALARLCPKAVRDVPVRYFYKGSPLERLEFLRSNEKVDKALSKAIDIVLQEIPGRNYRAIPGALSVFNGNRLFPGVATQVAFDPTPVTRTIREQKLLDESQINDLLVFAGFGHFWPRLAGDSCHACYDSHVEYVGLPNDDTDDDS